MSLSVLLNVQRKQSSAPLILVERSIRRSATALLEFWSLAGTLRGYLGHRGGHSDRKRVERVERVKMQTSKVVTKDLEKGDPDRNQ